MVQHCVNAANTDFGNYYSKKSCNAADVVGNKTSTINTNSLDKHIRTLGSLQAGTVDFVSNVLPNQTCSYSHKTNTTASSSSSSGYESISSKSHHSLFNRLKRLINFPTSRKTRDYQHCSNEQKLTHSPMLSFHENRRKSLKRNFSSTNQHIPFLYGLKNCGNTCYINAILQCLCHTEHIASYILDKSYEIDMRNIKNAHIENPIHFKLTKIFIQIFQTLWFNSSNTTTKYLYDFKTILANLNKQYSGNEQNDAQEFLLFLINTIHDELNLANIHRLRSQLIETDLAHQAWNEYLNANQSIITSTFSAQLHSTLICHHCQEESQTFEPYLFLSLPIPQKLIKSILITVVFLNQSPKQLQIGLCLPLNNTVKDVRETIAQQSNLDPNDIALMEIHPQNGFSQVFHDSESITRLNQDIYAIQFPSVVSTLDTNEQTTENSLPSFINLLILNRIKSNTGGIERFGAPIAVRVPRQSTYRSLQISIIKAQRSLIREEVMESANEYVVFQLTLVDQYQNSSSKQEYAIVHDVEWPLYFDKIDEILDTYVGQELGPSHIQIYANWNEKYLGNFLSKWSINDDKPDIHQSVAQARATLLHQPTSSLISLADCFSLFTQSECLNYDDAWMCTHCRRKENGTVKKLKIWTTPPVLIIHFKRFCQTKVSNAKLTYPIEFPLTDFNLKKILSTKDDENENENSYGLYDLFAVCNHRGSISNGHYTSFCKNPITDKWFCYDDHLVTEIDSSRVCTPDAYILFYKRRETPPSSLSSSEQQIDLIEIDLDEHEDKPLPLPRKLLPIKSQPPVPLPRMRLSTIEKNPNLWNRFNQARYSHDEIDSNVIYPNSTT